MIEGGGWNVHDINALYNEYAQVIYKHLLSIRCDHQTAEDLVQETFYQAIKSVNRYDGTCKISVWLCQIAKHLWYRELTRRNKVPTEKLTEGIADQHQTVVDELIEKETQDQLKKIIIELPELSQQVVNFRIYHNMSFREVGLVLGKTENWARVTYYRSKKIIIERWRENEP